MLNLLQCPICNKELYGSNEKLLCHECKNEYALNDGIPVIFRNNELKKIIQKDWENVADQLESDSVDPRRFDVRVWMAVSALTKVVNDKDAAILDVGCGTGSNLYLLKQLGYRRLYATEYSIRRMKTARKNFGDFSFVSTDCMPFKDATFDAVISTAVIEHVDKQDEFIKELARVMKPNGCAVITSDCYIYRFYSAIGSYRSIQPIDIAPNPISLLKEFRANNFEILHFDGFTSARFLLVKNLFKALLRNIFGDGMFLKVKNKMKYNNTHLHDECIVSIEKYMPKIEFSKSIRQLYKTFASQQNIFVIKKKTENGNG